MYDSRSCFLVHPLAQRYGLGSSSHLLELGIYGASCTAGAAAHSIPGITGYKIAAESSISEGKRASLPPLDLAGAGEAAFSISNNDPNNLVSKAQVDSFVEALTEEVKRIERAARTRRAFEHLLETVDELENVPRNMVNGEEDSYFGLYCH